MSDLEAFVDLYKRFGIELKEYKVESEIIITLISGSNEKFGGYEGFYSVCTFDINGKFVKQEFYE